MVKSGPILSNAKLFISSQKNQKFTRKVKTIPKQVQKKPTTSHMPQHDNVMTVAKA
jgi:hypothetical protein